MPGAPVFRDVLPPPLLRSLQLYVRALAETRSMKRDSWGRKVRHDDPFLVLVQEQRILPLVQDHLGHPIQRSYVFLASYLDGARVPAHRDREQCKYTLDLCIEDSGGGRPWPLHIEGRPVRLRSNQAVFYYGCEQVHHRDTKPAGKTANLAFFHFVDEDFSGPLG